MKGQGLFLALMVLLAGPVVAQWVDNGVPICTAPSYQQRPAATSDLLGGVILTWVDARPLARGVYAQKVNEFGEPQWTQNGVQVSNNMDNSHPPVITNDGTGGSIIAWTDFSNPEPRVLAQRLGVNGTLLWPQPGVEISTSNEGGTPVIVTDGVGGAIIAYRKYDGNSFFLYVQRVNENGGKLWPGDGVRLDNGDTPRDHSLIPDGQSGAVVAWIENEFVYACRLDSEGQEVWGNSLQLGFGHGVEEFFLGADNQHSAVISWVEQYNWPPNSVYLYAQKINSDGSFAWSGGGILVKSTEGLGGNIAANTSCSRFSGGVILIWNDSSDGYSFWGQSIDWGGIELWGASGVRVCTAESGVAPSVEANGNDGAIIIWRGDRDVVGQHIDSEGEPVWFCEWPICIAPEMQIEITVSSVDESSIFIAWNDQRSGGEDIYALTIDYDGFWSNPVPEIVVIEDVPGDVGGMVDIEFSASGYDVPGVTTFPIVGYNLWRKRPEPGPGREVAACYVPDKFEAVLNRLAGGQDCRGFVFDGDKSRDMGFPPGDWESLGFHAAIQAPTYYLTAPTYQDSTESDTGYVTFVVSVHTPTPDIFFVSDPDSGYSVNDDAITSVGRPVGREFSLGQNSPNPFNPQTTIRYSLPEPALVQLRIFDLAGRVVRVLVGGEAQGPGHFTENWDGTNQRNQAVASGTYFYRIEAGGYSETKRMVLLK